MTRALITLDSIDLTLGRTRLLEKAFISVAERDRICLVGRNGSGKSTLLKIAAGIVEPDAGNRFVHPAARVAYLAQEADFGGVETARAYVERQLAPTDDGGGLGRLLAELGLEPDWEPARLSGGEARRLAIAGVIAADPDVLLLDEPTNHLDIPAIEWLEKRLATMRAGIVLISHDRRLLERVSRATVWLDRGRTRTLDDGFAGFEAWRDKLLEEEEVEQHKLDRKIAREDQWMHGGVTARRKRNVRRVRELQALRETRRNAVRATGSVVLGAAEAGASGRIVIEAEGIAKAFDGRSVVSQVSIRIARGDKIGIVGPNGAGKSTLVALLTGGLPPDNGTVRIGTNVEMVRLDQRRDDLKADVTLSDALTGGRGDTVIVNGQARHVIGYMKDFLFSSDQARTPVGVLSGGERARLLLAIALARPANLLVLDEPTNDLDLETLDLLQEVLADYAGTLILVSHDRDFLDRTVTSTLASGGDGRWVEYAGGYSDMVAQRDGLGQANAEARRGPRISEGAGRNAPDAAAAARPRTKLSFKDRHALSELPARMERAGARIAKLEADLADPQLYAKDRQTFGALTDELSRVKAELAADEDRWLELEMLRQEIEG